MKERRKLCLFILQIVFSVSKNYFYTAGTNPFQFVRIGVPRCNQMGNVLNLSADEIELLADFTAFGHNNPDFCQKEICWINDPRNIAKNDHVVSINNAMEIDLTGQVNAESIGPRQYSGTGGQLEWVVGSQWSKGGKSILALRSSYRDKAGVLHSKIVPQLAPGSVVTTPRTCVQYVVTEFGVADLKYKSTVERARALIAIAHPDFRRELERQMPL